MDPVRNPYAPGAGSPPPELAGRGDIRKEIAIRLQRLRLGRPAKSMMLVGLRGVGKTVLLDQMRRDAEASGIQPVRIEAPGESLTPRAPRSGSAACAAPLQQERGREGLRHSRPKALAGFASKLKLTYADIEVGFDYDPEPGLADNGDLEGDLGALLEQVGAQRGRLAQPLCSSSTNCSTSKKPQMAALIAALHRCSQEQLPVTIVGAGLPQLRGRMGEAKSYAERLFDFPEIGPLSPPTPEMPSSDPPRTRAPRSRTTLST